MGLSPLENHRYAMRRRSIQLSPLESYGYASMRAVAKGAHGEIRGEIRLSPLENADYADTQKPRVNPTSTPSQPRVIPASSPRQSWSTPRSTPRLRHKNLRAKRRNHVQWGDPIVTFLRLPG